MKYSSADITKLGTILGIWAHPDDEAWTMAGVIAAAHQNNQRVIIVTATRGEAGQTTDQDRWPQAKLGQIRERELEAALKILGVDRHHWLNLPDGKLSQISTPIKRLTDIIKDLQPDTIFSFAKDGITGHPDHVAVCNWTRAATQAADSPAQLFGAIESTEKYQAVCDDCPAICRDVYFNTAKPVTMPIAKVDLCFPLTPALQKIKRQALLCQPSQTSQLFNHAEGQAFINEQITCECFVRL